MVLSPPVADDTAFHERAEVALRGLFTQARVLKELHFALSLSPEFRGTQAAGWNTAHEAMAAVGDYMEFFKNAAPSRVNVRIALSFYSHLAEASGFYEVPKNMLRIVEGLARAIRAAMNVIVGVVRASPIGVAAEHLIELVRLPSGKFADDVAVVLVSASPVRQAAQASN